MKNQVWTCTAFKGVWPTNTAAVIVAPTRKEAKRLLVEELTRINLRQDIGIETIQPVDVDGRPSVQILSDGDY